MKEKNVAFKFVLLASFCSLVLATGGCGPSLPPGEYSTERQLPLIKLTGKSNEITTCQYLGSWLWLVPEKNAKARKDKNSWMDAVRMTFEKDQKTFKIDADTNRLPGAKVKRLTLDADPVIFKKIAWQDNQVSLFAFRALSPRRQVALMEIGTDNIIALYVNQTPAKEISAGDNVELGTNLLIPVNLEEGENTFVIKVFSNAGPPQLRMSLTLDQSKDFQAAWNTTWGFLNKLVYKKTGDTFETPFVRWDVLFDRMTISAEVSNALTGSIVFKSEMLNNRNLIRDRGKPLGQGIYEISYKSNYSKQDTASEYFLVGSPVEAYNAIKKSLGELPWSADEQLNIEAQTRRAEILLDKNDYTPENKQWQEKFLYTLDSLAKYVHLKKEKKEDVSKDLPGLQFRGFVSKIDNSKQFYRLFVPSNYTGAKKLPLLLVMHTTMQHAERSFLESPFTASQRQAVRICKFAEKYGFGILWPGYRSAPEGWTYDLTHIEEALSNVEASYNIDSSQLGLYGVCSGGFLEGRLASTYPNRYAAIVYDRAIFEREPDTGFHGGMEYAAYQHGTTESIIQWLRAINPTDRIIANQNLKILVLNDGTKVEGHGEMALTKLFLNRSLPKRPDIKYTLGQRKIGVVLWDSVFQFLAGCKNEHPGNTKIDIPAENGYAGPMSEVFATPFIVVEGTRAKPEEAHFMETAIKNLKAQYHDQFYEAEFILKKDSEVTDEDIAKYSLVLVGNAESNAVWGRLAAKYADSMTPYSPKDDWPSSSTKSVFAEVFRNPANKNNYLLLIGSNDLSSMAYLRDFNPFTAWFDCYVYKYREGHEKEYTIARRP